MGVGGWCSLLGQNICYFWERHVPTFWGMCDTLLEILGKGAQPTQLNAVGMIDSSDRSSLA